MVYKLFILTALVGVFAMPSHADEQKLVIVRHGEAESNIAKVYNFNPEDPAYKVMNLTAKGKEQAQQAAKALLAKGFNNDNIAAVFVSPLPRTRQTAELMAQAGLFSKDKIIVSKEVTEAQGGDLEGKPAAPVWTDEIANAHHGETLEQIQARVKQFYQSLKAKYPQGNILVITHAVPGESLIEVVTGNKAKLNTGDFKVISCLGSKCRAL